MNSLAEAQRQYGCAEWGPRAPVTVRLLRRSVEDGECWVWQGATSPDGYGLAQGPTSRRNSQTHRLSYEAFVGPIPAGMHIDHLCRTRGCLRPSHLEPVTPAENARRARLANSVRSTA